MDVHQENLIACGEHPILIDLETLLHPRPVAQESASTAHSSAIDGQDLEHSVLRTGMLPFSESFFDYHLPEDISGLGGSAAAGSSHCADDRPAGEPGAQVRSESAVPSREPNLPIHDGRALRAEDHEDDLVAGFAGMCDFLQARRQRLLADDGPLRWLADCPARFLFRDTRTYALLFERLWHPPYLRDGVDWSIETAVLYRAAAGLGEKPRFWPLIAAEIVALQRLDVPLFTVSSTSDVVTMGGGEMVEGLFEAPSLHLVRRRIERLCKEDLDQQVSWIRRSLYRARLRGAVRPAPVQRALDGPAHADTASSSLPKGGHRDE
jgi:lantibiotic modifying enzyme